MSPTKVELKPCAKKMSVFEEQLSLIGSPSAKLNRPYTERKKQRLIGCLTHNSDYSCDTGISNDSTLIGSPGSIGSGSPRFKYKLGNGSHIMRRRNTIRVRIPFSYVIQCQFLIEKMVRSISDYGMSFTKSQVYLFIDLVSIFVLGGLSTFGSELLRYSKKLFLSSFPLSGICIINFTRRDNMNPLLASSIDYLIQSDERVVSSNFKKMAFQVIIGSQVLLLGSLIKVAAVFQHQEIEGGNNTILDQSALFALILLISSLTVNMILDSIPKFFRFFHLEEEKRTADLVSNRRSLSVQI